MKRKNMHIKSILSLLFGKMAMVGILIIVQILFVVGSVVWLADYFAAVYVVLNIFSILIVIWLFGKDENPSYKMAWVFIIMALPIFGGLFYLMFGNKRMPHITIDRMNHWEKRVQKSVLKKTGCLEQLDHENPHLVPLARYLSSTTGFPLCSKTQAEYLSIGEEIWEKMLEELRKAEKFIFMEYFIVDKGIMWDSIFEIFKEKAKQGVDIRFMYDDIGSIHTLPHRFQDELRKDGIQCVLFNPFQPHLNSMMNYRDHRKITVIDGNVGFCTGINVADEYINAFEKHGHWKDTGVLLRGEAVGNLTSMFLSLWNFSCPTDTDFEQFQPTAAFPSDGFVQPFGDTPLDGINVEEDAYMQIINRATRYVYITTPYLIIDHEMITALCTAARSGIDVRIITPHVPDKWFVHETSRSFYQILLDAGVRIYEYTPGFVHAKMYVSDDNVAIVGTANMDYRSFYLHFECGVCFYQSPIVQDVLNDILETLKKCQEIPKDYNRTVALPRRLIRPILRLFSPMM